MKTTTLSNGAKKILETLKQETQRKKPFVREMLEHEKNVWFDKMGLIETIEKGYLSDEVEINQMLELIELIGLFNAKTHIYGTQHLMSYDKRMNTVIESIYQNELRRNFIHFSDGKVYLNSEEEPYPSLVILLNEIELRMFGIHEEELSEVESS